MVQVAEMKLTSQLLNRFVIPPQHMVDSVVAVPSSLINTLLVRTCFSDPAEAFFEHFTISVFLSMLFISHLHYTLTSSVPLYYDRHFLQISPLWDCDGSS